MSTFATKLMSESALKEYGKGWRFGGWGLPTKHLAWAVEFKYVAPMIA